MNNEREIFLKKINEFIISSQNNKKELKSAYLQLVKEYHPDKNNRLDKEILNEYMIIINNAYNEIIKKPGKIKLKDKQNNSGYFYINAFCQLLSKIKTISSNNGKTNDPKEGEYRNLVIKEISKYNQKAGESFSLLLSRETTGRKGEDAYLKGIAAYEQIFNNIYIYTRYYIKKKQRAANNYFHECKDGQTEEIKAAIENITKWFNELIEKIG